ncbi:hypothetical protein Gohar_005202 [Gossypium harknessii]|uniref:HMA domain-containing protein n=1 Tax=Gossypium harknessii TaxID=34285 RepID=A0A7J9H7C0_9ROSI|nr:hypothetical protein [Gossypium harknessii]
MVLPSQLPKKDARRIEFNNPRSFLLPGSSLASVESLSMPLVHEVVYSADIRCAECQMRIADIISRMNENIGGDKGMASGRLAVRVFWEALHECIVSQSLIWCALFQINAHNYYNNCLLDPSRTFFNKFSDADTDSVLVNVLENKVTLTSRYPGSTKLGSRQVPVIYRNPISTMAMIKKLFRLSLLCNDKFDKKFPGFHIEEIETHLIEKQQCKVSVCGRLRPSDVAIKIRKKMNRRVEILEINEVEDEQTEQNQITSQ